MAYVFYASGLSINVMYSIEDGGKRAVGFKLSDGMEIPDELAAQLKFARQKSKLAGTIRGSYFVIKGEYYADPAPLAPSGRSRSGDPTTSNRNPPNSPDRSGRASAIDAWTSGWASDAR